MVNSIVSIWYCRINWTRKSTIYETVKETSAVSFSQFQPTMVALFPKTMENVMKVMIDVSTKYNFF